MTRAGSRHDRTTPARNHAAQRALMGTTPRTRSRLIRRARSTTGQRITPARRALASTMEKRADLFNADQFLPYMLFNKEMEATIIGYKGYTKADFYIPLLRYYGKRDALLRVFQYCINPSNNPVKRIKGYEGVEDLSWHNDLDKVKKKMKYNEVKIDTTTISLFEKYIIDCKKQNIRVLLLNTPEFIDGQLFTKNLKDVIQIYKNISTKYDVPFYDFSNDSMSYQKKYFFNAEHLNKLGAETFTKKLIDTLKRSALLDGIKTTLSFQGH